MSEIDAQMIRIGTVRELGRFTVINVMVSFR